MQSTKLQRFAVPSVVMLAFGLAGCGSSSDEAENTTTGDSTSSGGSVATGGSHAAGDGAGGSSAGGSQGGGVGGSGVGGSGVGGSGGSVGKGGAAGGAGAGGSSGQAVAVRLLRSRTAAVSRPRVCSRKSRRQKSKLDSASQGRRRCFRVRRRSGQSRDDLSRHALARSMEEHQLRRHLETAEHRHEWGRRQLRHELDVSG